MQDNGVAQTFANTAKVLEALSDGVVVVDRSHWGRLRIAGKDRLDLLHNQSTAAFKDLKPGTGCDTVSVPPGCAGEERAGDPDPLHNLPLETSSDSATCMILLAMIG